MLLNQASDIDGPLRNLHDYGAVAQKIPIDVSELLDEIALAFRAHDSHLRTSPSMMRVWYARIGYVALELIGHGFEPEAFKAMLMKKHVAYGDTGLIKWGHFGMFMRLGSKVDRFNNLTKNPERGAGSDESVNDTLTDIVGYCVLGITMLNKGYHS